MASETPIENQSAIAWQPAAGSLQAMNLGCMPLGQLGQLVNWRNEKTYTLPECNPWVELPLAAVITSDQSVPAAVVSAELTKPVEAPTLQPVQQPVGPSDVVAAAPTSETPTDEKALLEAQAEEAKAHKLAAQEIAAAAVKEAAAAKELEAAKQAAAAEDVAAKAKAAADKEASAASEAAANAATKAATEERAARDATVAREAATKEAAAKEAQESAARETSAKQAAATKAAAESAPAQLSVPSVPTFAKEIKSDVATKRSPALVSQREDNRVADSQPTGTRTEPLSLNLDETAPFLASSHRAPRNESSSDDYLLQLERLVLELNMELGRSRGEPKPVDPIEQMANRIIALNLENLALREKLQRTLNAN